MLACSLDTDLNYGLIYSNDIFEPNVMLPFINLCIQEEQKVRQPEVSGTHRGTEGLQDTIVAIQQVYSAWKSLF